MNSDTRVEQAVNLFVLYLPAVGRGEHQPQKFSVRSAPQPLVAFWSYAPPGTSVSAVRSHGSETTDGARETVGVS